jgi:hypothetical protein
MPGDLAERIKQIMVGTIAGPDLVRREAILAHLEQMENELAGSDPTPLERVMIQRVLAC